MSLKTTRQSDFDLCQHALQVRATAKVGNASEPCAAPCQPWPAPSLRACHALATNARQPVAALRRPSPARRTRAAHALSIDARQRRAAQRSPGSAYRPRTALAPSTDARLAATALLVATAC